jgi:transposase
VDRAKRGSKHHLITCGAGNPLATETTAANVNDVTRFVALVDAVPPVRGRRGRPRRRPRSVYGDRAYHSRKSREEMRRRRVKVRVARPGDPHGSGLGRTRWVVERTLSWLHQYRRLRVRYERRADIHEALLTIGCCLICFKQLQTAGSL